METVTLVLMNSVPLFADPLHPDDDEFDEVSDDNALDPVPTVTGPGCTSPGYPKTTAVNSINPRVAAAATFVLRGNLVGACTTTASGASV